MRLWRAKSGWTLIAAIAMVICLASCGGGSEGTVQTPPPPPPPPPPLAITTATLLPGAFYSEFYSVTLEASGGTGARTWTARSGDLPLGLDLDHASGTISGVLISESSAPGTASVEITVRDSASPGQTSVRRFDLPVATRAPKILTTVLPDAVVGRRYEVRIATTHHQPLRLAALQGTPPAGILLTFQQKLEGTPTLTGTSSFVLEAVDSNGTVVDQRAFSLRVVGVGFANRNDDISNAPLLSNGTYFANISPFVDPPTSQVPNPDHDFYRLTALPGSVVQIEINAALNASPLDSVIELVDSAGTRLNTCNSPGQSGFTHPCMNDDNVEQSTLDSKLLFRAPAGAATTFFLHVLDWRGDGRNDMLYQFQIFGAD